MCILHPPPRDSNLLLNVTGSWNIIWITVSDALELPKYKKKVHRYICRQHRSTRRFSLSIDFVFIIVFFSSTHSFCSVWHASYALRSQTHCCPHSIPSQRQQCRLVALINDLRKKTHSIDEKRKILNHQKTLSFTP